ncbi:MAG: N4-gp56 family major capsid protein [Gemmatimonadaceae bacterium]|nr:N4-gp56 family major capsid protein [Gemmatimonadaceae bacterium]
MADTLTGTSALLTDTAAYERLAYFPYRAENMFAQVADVKPTNQTHNGATVLFTKYTDMAIASTPLSEAVDVDAVAIADAQVTVTLQEYGNAVIPTAKLRATSYIDIDPVIGNLLGYNAGITIDTVARSVIEAGTNVLYSGAASSRVTVAATHVLTSANVRRAYAELSDANVPGWGGMYVCFISPKVMYDLKQETGDLGWRAPHVYSDPSNIYNGEAGSFEGFRFIVTPRAPLFVNGGVGSTVDVYRTLFLGRQAIATAHSNAGGYGPNPIVVKSPIVDHLRRFEGWGWKHFVGFARFREEAMRAYESSSSIGAN